MTKQQIIELFSERYAAFVKFIDELSATEYTHTPEGKWSAGQQLQHLVLSIEPLVQVLSIGKAYIEKKFGSTDKESRSYTILQAEYLEKLKNGGKAPDQFLPKSTTFEEKPILVKNLLNLIKDLCVLINTYSEQELDTLLLPHPLLGKISLREMLYNALYHVEHHKRLTEINLKMI